MTAEEFDELLGHSVAVTDAAASVFAAEMVAAYPGAKVVLNMRRDLEGWERSLDSTLVHANESWGFWIASWLDRECFWAWHVYERFLWPLLFRAGDGDLKRAIQGNARWVQRGELICFFFVVGLLLTPLPPESSRLDYMSFTTILDADPPRTRQHGPRDGPQRPLARVVHRGRVGAAVRIPGQARARHPIPARECGQQWVEGARGAGQQAMGGEGVSELDRTWGRTRRQHRRRQDVRVLITLRLETG